MAYIDVVIELRDLLLIRSVAKTGSLTGAAQEMFISQPAASQQMRALERRIGTPIITRTSRGARLTSAGSILLENADIIHDLIQTSLREVAAVANLETGSVRLAGFGGAGVSLLSRTLGRLSRRFPELQISLLEEEPASSIPMVLASDVDIAVTYSYPNNPMPLDSALEMVHLRRDDMLLAIPDNHDVNTAAGAIELSLLSEETWIAGCTACRDHLNAVCRSAGFVPSVLYSADDSLAVQGLVSEGLGIALISSQLAGVVSLPGVAFKRLSPPAYRDIFAVVRRDQAVLPVVQSTLAALAKDTATAPSREALHGKQDLPG